jgi:hypothetical protein
MRNQIGQITIAMAILLATILYAKATRYQVTSFPSPPGERSVYVLDRWTGVLK